MAVSGRCRCDCSTAHVRRVLLDNKLLVAVFVSVIIGAVLGLGLRNLDLDYTTLTWIGIWGELFLRMLKMIVLPLTMSCIIVGVASMESSSSGKLGVLTLGYAFITQLIAIIIGVISVMTIKPGDGYDAQPPASNTSVETSYTDVFTDLLRNIIPDNIIKACTHTVYTKVERVVPVGEINKTLIAMNVSETIVTRNLVFREGMNLLGIIIFSMMIAVAISSSGEKGRPLYQLFISLNDVVMIVMKAVMWYSPLGIMSLICSALLSVDDLGKAMVSLGLFMVTIVTGCLLHQLIVLPVLVAVICKRNPYTYFLGIFDGYLAGIASLSSVTAMPYLLQSCPEKLGVSRRVSQFTLPVLISVNRDGSALFITVAVIFIAQTYSVQLGAIHILMIIILIAVLSVTTTVIPSGAVMVIIMMANVMQLPMTERLGMIMAVEWFNDRIRTGTNIASHGYGCAIIDSIAMRTIPKLYYSPGRSNIPEDKEAMEMMYAINIDEDGPQKEENI